MANNIRQRRMQANYINTTPSAQSPVYSLLGVGAKAVDENPSAQTKSRRYIVDKSSTKSVSGYDWNSSFDIDQIRDQAAISFLCNIGEQQHVGEDAETEYVIVDLDQPITGQENTYHARHFDIAVEITSFPNEDGEMGCTGNFLAKGDPTEGVFNTSTKTFSVPSAT